MIDICLTVLRFYDLYMHDNKQEDDNKQAWLGTFFCISNTCGVGLNRVGRDRETKEEHDKDCLRGFSVF